MEGLEEVCGWSRREQKEEEEEEKEEQQSARMDLVSALPGELGSLVVGWLDGRDLLACAHVGNWAWNALARHRLPWKHLTLERMRDKQRPAVRSFLRSVYFNYVEKMENSNNSQEEGADVDVDCDAWTWREWARSYFMAEHEGYRSRLRDGRELAAQSWRFVFRVDTLPSQGFPSRDFHPRFHDDGHYEHDGLFSASLVWRFIDLPDYDGAQGRRLVQVSRFPALRVRRTADWGWVLENDFVVFESEDLVLAAKRKKREERAKLRLARLTKQELDDLLPLSAPELRARLAQWHINVEATGSEDVAAIVAMVSARVEQVREELQAQEEAKQEQPEGARQAHRGLIK